MSRGSILKAENIGTLVLFLIILFLSPESAFSEDPLKEKGSAPAIILHQKIERLGEDVLMEPLGLAADPDRFLFVADAMTGKVFRFSPDGSHIEFENPPRNASFYPIDLALNGPFVYILDYSRNRVLRYDGKGSYLDILISFEGVEGMKPVSLTGGNGGRFLTADPDNHAVAVWSPFLDIEISWDDFGLGEGSFNRPVKAAMLPDERIIVADQANRRVQVFSPSGAFESLLTLPGGSAYRSPRYLATDGEGYVFIADSEAGAVFVFDSQCRYVQKIDSFFDRKIRPAAVTIGWNDDLYIADIGSHSILVFKMIYPGK
ncbi:MAG: NHL repeat-containing protein [Candidatus Krumholzibacteriota bacterium]|nr:NHL repeat-containing protein [Candidatus Krumholzibacteriota bacterium]